MVWTEIPLDGRSDLYVFSRGHMTAAIHSHVIRDRATCQAICRSYC